MSSMCPYSPLSGRCNLLEFIQSLTDFPTLQKKKIDYLNVPAAFDIETSSFYDSGEKRAIMYFWMFGINNHIVTGRTWDEFKTLLLLVQTKLNLSENRRLVVYVHNLAYEFQFIRKHFNWNDVFLLDERKPVYAHYDGIEFRCSLKLSGGKSLAKVADDLQRYPIKKLVGNLDYSLIRTPITPLTEPEMDYGENDVRVLLHYIQEKIEHDGGINKIPLTNTGYVREYCRKACYRNWKRYRNLMNELTIEPDEYTQLKRAFQGGFTHANANHAFKVLEDVHSNDLASSYPTVMVLEQFPMSKAETIDHIESKEHLEHLLRTYCCLFDIELTNLVPTNFQDNPISASKCFYLENAVENNGRVVTATRLRTTVTEQDFFTYRIFYRWDKLDIANFKIYRKGYLPSAFVKSILKLYYDKTVLKGDIEQLVNYMISKNMINAAYGMMVTDINRQEFKYNIDKVDKPVRNLVANIEKYNNSVKRFLFYPWGVWVTAYARSNLFSAIYELGDDYIYADTDSVKYFNRERHMEYFDKYTDVINKKINAAAVAHGIDASHFSPLNMTIGIWDYEGKYDHFKTLGAKRYLTEKGGKYSLTVAGVNKKSACKFLVETKDPFGKFTENLVVPKECSKRNVLTYIDFETSGAVVDYNGVLYNYHELSSVHMEGTEYSFSISEQYKNYLKGIRNGDEFG